MLDIQVFESPCSFTDQRTGKILKHLAAMSAIRETAANTYENTPFSKGLLDPTHSSFIHYG